MAVGYAVQKRARLGGWGIFGASLRVTLSRTCGSGSDWRTTNPEDGVAVRQEFERDVTMCLRAVEQAF